MPDMSVADEIQQIKMEQPHVVLLGAGASRAAFPNGDANGKRLPVMADFINIVPITNILKKASISYRGRNFEEVYSDICAKQKFARVREAIECAINDYFASLSLPTWPTLYDHLILSLRKKDVVATFNWDPFLVQAIQRNQLVRGQIPSVLFLHGNVAAGYCPRDNVHGMRGNKCSCCGSILKTSRLLYPISTKTYVDDPSIADAWRMAQASLKSAFMVTIFGYGAPQSDVSAVELLLNAWGGSDVRSMEQFEIIDVREEDDLLATWKRFIHTHHYEVHSNVYDSWLFNHPRRTGEAYISQYLEAKFIKENPIPKDKQFQELWEWFAPLVAREPATA